MGSNHPLRRELPAELLERAALIAADSVEQAGIEAGDLLLGLAAESWGRVVELHSLAAAPRPVDGISIFKSVGLGVEDVRAAAYVYEQACRLGIGSEMPALYS
jgi:ornithine cyclodeaminase/alanine dehydrogenase-like protein (mu-crystallin family)